MSNINHIKLDLHEIAKYGFSAKVKTPEGKIHLMMHKLKDYLKYKDFHEIKKINAFLNKPENMLSTEMKDQYSDLLQKMNKLIGKKDDKGFWEYSIFQKVVILNEEQNIKCGLKQDNTLDLKKIDQYLNPQISREEQLVINFNNKIPLSNKDMIIYNLYISKKNEELKKDLIDINKLGIKASPATSEGKIHYLMYILDMFINKNQTDQIANVYLKLKDPKYILTTELESKYNDLLNKMNIIVNNLNLIELQFTKFYNQMPPLNQKGFNAFDDWQIETINNINNNKSTLISAPTSAGKSIISGYVVTKGRSLYIVPTDALAWQVASYIGGILNADIPILTLTYQSIPKRDDLIKLLNNSIAIVGTSESILDYLPFINCNFKWIILDEIHMMGKNEGSGIEAIIKILSNSLFLGLSATIGNLSELQVWFESICNKSINTIVCNKRFFNLQKYFFDNTNDSLVMLNPLSLISYTEFEDKSILTKTLYPTPRDTWSLVQKLLSNNIELNGLDPYIFFDKDELIELSKTYDYFNKLINFMVVNYSPTIKSIINEYSSYNFKEYDTNIINILNTLEKFNNFPAILFQQNTIECLNIVRILAENLEEVEAKKYPNLIKERINKDKEIKKINQKIEKELNELTDKQLDKKLKDNRDFVFDFVAENNVNAPHPDFIYNKETRFNDNEISEWAEKFKMYFPFVNGNYHYLIRLLWRGIGVYTNGLPDNYLRLVQKLASKKKLALVISDISLVFGISMPFRSSIIYRTPDIIDNLDPMIYHQMAGRAGRRGLDKEGNVIFVGYSWDRIKELSVSSIPNIEGINKIIWSGIHGNLMSNNINYLKLNKQLFNSTFSENYITNFDNNLVNEYNNLWSLSIEKDINILQLMWNLRYSNEGITLCILLPFLKKYFDTCNPNEEIKQIEIAYLLSKFIHWEEASSEENIIPELNGTKINFDIIYTELNNYNIVVPIYIDGKIWLSIRNNRLLDLKDNILRQRLFDFSTKIKSLQHYCYHIKHINLTKLLGKLLTRIWWIYHSSSPILLSSIEK